MNQNTSYIPSWEQVRAPVPASEQDATQSRRTFLRGVSRVGLGVAGLGVAAAAVTHSASKTLTFADMSTFGLLKLPGLDLKADVRVLNYALTLEDLESELYRQCVARLTGGGVTQQGGDIPGLHLDPFLPDVYHIMQFSDVEAAHRDFLRQALKINGIIPFLPTKPRLYNFGVEKLGREEILALLIDVEATGAAAYLGAIPYLRTKLFLTAAAGIQGTEARHTASLQAIQNRLLSDKLIATGTPMPPAPLASNNHGIDTPMDPDAVLAKVSPFFA